MITFDGQSLESFFWRCQDSGEQGLFPAGVYAFDPIRHRMRGDLSIECEPGARFIYKSRGSVESLLRFVGMHKYQLRWSGGEFDTTKGVFIPAKGSNTALALQAVAGGDIERVFLNGGDSYRYGPETDSGISTVNCGPVTIRRCRFRGWNDLGVYGSGGGRDDDRDDGDELTVTNCQFEYCNVAASHKRAGESFRFTDNDVLACGSGPTTFYANGLAPAKRIICTGNEIRQCSNLGVNMLGGERGSIIAHNVITNLGSDGADDRPIAIRLSNTSGVRVVANSFHGRGWGVNISGTSRRNTVALNDFTGFDMQYIEANRVGPNRYIDNDIVGEARHRIAHPETVFRP